MALTLAYGIFLPLMVDVRPSFYAGFSAMTASFALLIMAGIRTRDVQAVPDHVITEIHHLCADMHDERRRLHGHRSTRADDASLHEVVTALDRAYACLARSALDEAATRLRSIPELTVDWAPSTLTLRAAAVTSAAEEIERVAASNRRQRA